MLEDMCPITRRIHVSYEEEDTCVLGGREGGPCSRRSPCEFMTFSGCVAQMLKSQEVLKSVLNGDGNLFLRLQK